MPMKTLVQSSERTYEETWPKSAPTSCDLFLRDRIKIVEDLWESVLRQECGQQLIDILQQMR